jgi:hypothetical protein
MGKARAAGGDILDSALAKRPSVGRIEKTDRIDFLSRGPALVGGHGSLRPLEKRPIGSFAERGRTCKQNGTTHALINKRLNKLPTFSKTDKASRP